MFPKTGPLWKQIPISRALLGISFGFALPPGFPLRAPSLRGALLPEPFFIHLSKSLVYEGSPVGPLCRKMPISRALLYVSFRVPSKGDLFQVFLTWLP